MRRMGIDKSMTVGQALEFFPQLYTPLLSMGLCCVNEDTALWTMERLAAEVGADVDELCAALNALL